MAAETTTRDAMNPLQRISKKRHIVAFAAMIAVVAAVGANLTDYLVMEPDIFQKSRQSSFVTATSLGFVISYYIGTKLLEINTLTAKLDFLASYDFLTGAMTRAKFFNHLSSLPDRAGACLVFDMDNFKQINDRLGHSAGDAALFKVAQAARKYLGPRDCLCRMGGDEFCAYFPGIDMDEAALIAQWIKQRIAGESVGSEGETMALSASFGLAALPTGGDIDAAIAVADAELYHAKARRKREIPAADAGRHIRSRRG